jgi:hypothetical protein
MIGLPYISGSHLFRKDFSIMYVCILLNFNLKNHNIVVMIKVEPLTDEIYF